MKSHIIPLVLMGIIIYTSIHNHKIIIVSKYNTCVVVFLL